MRTLIVATLLASCSAWHAYLDVETLPERAGTALSSNLQLPVLEHRNTVCFSESSWKDSIGQNCEDYKEAPAQMCASGNDGARARDNCCACGGGRIIEDTYEVCQIARTSLNRAIIMCAADADSIACSRECVASWNSVVRDAEALVGSPCIGLEVLMNEAYPFTMSGGGLFNHDELEAIATNCAQFCPEETQYCGFSENNEFVGASPAPSSFWLRPPSNVCPNFQVTDGVSKRSVLTWQVIDYYVSKQWACTGGLSLLGEIEPQSSTQYRSWACVYEPSCKFLDLNDDMVCYKYSNLRGEFHYWGLNSNLTLAHLPFMISASFCDDAGGVLLQDARNASILIDLDTVGFTFTRQTPDGQKPHVVSGRARNNGQGGCGIIKLRKDSRYKLEIDAGINYYPYDSFVITTNKSLEINAAMMGVMGDVRALDPALDCDNLAISLTWCQRDPVDLDLFVFIPGPDGTVATGEESSVYWAWPTGMQKSNNYTMELERDDLGVDERSGARSFGPETIRLAGNMALGIYAVMVHVHNPNGVDALPADAAMFHRGCASVSVYSSMRGGVAPEGKLTWTVADEDELVADWWHVFNLEVKMEVEAQGYGANVNARQGKVVVVHNVDKMVRPGPRVDDEGSILGTFAIPPHSFSDLRWLEAYQENSRQSWRSMMRPRDFSMGTEVRMVVDKTQMTLVKYASGTGLQCDGTWLQVVVLSAADMPLVAVPIAAASVTLIQAKIRLDNREVPEEEVDDWLLTNAEQAKSTLLTVAASDLKVERNGRGVLVGGFKYFGRISKLLVTANGFFPQIYDVKLQPGEYLRRVKIFVVPDDGLSRVILRWGNHPADCDIYVVPQNVKDPATDNPVAWRTDDGKRSQNDLPYVYFDLCNCFDCTCDAPMLQATSARQTAVVALGRDDTTHGQADEEGVIANGPETMSLVDLLPGKYLVFINAGVSTDGGLTYPSFSDAVKIEIALGNGTYSTRGPTIDLDPLQGGPTGLKWRNIGTVAPSVGRQLTNGRLRSSLSSRDELTQVEWNSFGIVDLRVDDYIKVGNSYFKPAGQGKWFYAGYFHVTSTSDPVCEPDYINPVDGTRRSLLHHTHALCYTFVVTGKMVRYKIQRANSALAPTITPVPNVEYVMDGGLYRALDLVNLPWHDPQEVPTWIKFKAQGYKDEILTFKFFGGEWPELLQAWMVRDDGKTHVVMRWGDYPSDLDLYMLPLGVHDVDEDKTPVEWTVPRYCRTAPSDDQVEQDSDICGPWVLEDESEVSRTDSRAKFVLPASQSYLWYMQKQIQARTPDVEFVKGRSLRPLLTLDRDDSGHQPPQTGGDQAWPNGPEALTLENLLPGTYEVYIAGYDANDARAVLSSGLTVEVYLGDGRSQMRKAASVQLMEALEGAKWYFTGRFVVTHGDDCAPDSTDNMWQSTAQGSKSKYCYAWYSAGAVFSKFYEYLLQISRINDAATGDELSSAKYVLDLDLPTRVKGRIHRLTEGEHTIEMRMDGYVTRRVRLLFAGGFGAACWQSELSNFEMWFAEIASSLECDLTAPDTAPTLHSCDECISLDEFSTSMAPDLGLVGTGISSTFRLASNGDDCISQADMTAWLVVASNVYPALAPIADKLRQSRASEECIHKHWIRRTVDFLALNDGWTRILLRWGDTPADLDTYVVPSQVETLVGTRVAWKTQQTDGSVQPTLPYVNWEDRTLIATASESSSVPLSGLEARISLDRDDRIHGMSSPTGITDNGPETTTFRRLLPGRYDVYINVWAEALSFKGGVTVEVYLGDGVSTCMVDVVPCDLMTGRWFHAGYFVVHTTREQLERFSNGTAHLAASNRWSQQDVGAQVDAQCAALNSSRPQLLPGNGYNMTYTWFRVGQPVDTPKVVTSGPEEFGRRRRHHHHRSDDDVSANAVARDGGKGNRAGFVEDDRHEKMAKRPARSNASRRKTWSEDGARRFS